MTHKVEKRTFSVFTYHLVEAAGSALALVQLGGGLLGLDLVPVGGRQPGLVNAAGDRPPLSRGNGLGL